MELEQDGQSARIGFIADTHNTGAKPFQLDSYVDLK
jgi:hypothetical protein